MPNLRKTLESKRVNNAGRLTDLFLKKADTCRHPRRRGTRIEKTTALPPLIAIPEILSSKHRITPELLNSSSLHHETFTLGNLLSERFQSSWLDLLRHRSPQTTQEKTSPSTSPFPTESFTRPLMRAHPSKSNQNYINKTKKDKKNLKHI